MLFDKFCRSKSGNFALMLAFGLPAVLTAVAFAVDVSTLMRAKVSLQNALDAANLASSHLGDIEASRKDVFDRYFQTNVAGHSELRNAEATLTVERGLNYIQTKAVATADVNLNFAFLFGNDKRITVDAGAVESTNQLEVVLVLDNTGSMASNDRIGALRTAATALIDMLEAAKSPTRSVRVAVVPFVTAVNVKGEDYDPAWIDMAGKSPNNGANFPSVGGKRVNHMDLFKQLGVEWRGCVEARPGTNNVSDISPDQNKPDTLFVPYFAPDDPGNARNPNSSYGNSATGYNNSYLDDTVVTLLPGLTSDMAKYSVSTMKLINDKRGPLTIGPNRACPTPIVPLTDDFDKLRKAVGEMIEWNGSGTNVSEGLSWGMRVLSPEPPYSDGAPFRASGTTKTVLLLTDGENVVYGAKDTPQKSDYGSYGFLASGRFGSSDQTAAARNVDDWTTNVCNTLKKQDVQIFTVLLQADTAANRKLYEACASSPSDYYPTNDVSQLESVFLKIGSSISQLHLTN
ncbi:pilus assembly protein [Mesorhizobium sp. M0854]|uniref:pilus assembly protein n=1 Tax=unclassified Mesorhizobium TaxID=325217 RepID=UPI00333AFB9A